MSAGVSATSSANELTFEMRVRPASNAVAEMRRFADDIIREQNRINEAANRSRGGGGSDPAARAAMESARRAAAERRRIDREERIEREHNLRERLQAEKSAAAERVAAERAAMRERQRIERQADAERQRADRQRAAEAEKAARAAAAAARRASAEQEREEDRIHHRHRMRQLERARRNRMEREAQALDVGGGGPVAQAGAVGNAAASGSGELERDAMAFADLRDEFNRAFESVLKLGKGFALLGLIGEKETEKILQVLLKVQAAAFISKGAIQGWQLMADVIKRYRDAAVAARVAQEALNASQMRGMVTSSSAAMAGRGVSTAGVAAQFAGMLGSSGKVAPPSSMAAMITSGGMAASGAGAAAGSSGAGAAAAGTATAGVGLTVGAFVAAAASVVAAGKVLTEAFTGTADAAGSWSRAINENLWLPLGEGIANLFGSDLMGNKAAKRAEQQRAAAQVDREFRTAQGSTIAGGQISRSRLAEELGGYGVSIDAIQRGGMNADAYRLELGRRESSVADARLGVAGYGAARDAAEGRLAAAESSRWDYMRNATASRGPSAAWLENVGRSENVDSLLSQARSDLAGAKGDDARLALTQRIADLERTRVSLMVESARIAKEEGRTRVEAGRESLRTLESEKRERTEMIKRIEDSLKTARERFGEMDPSQRMTAVSGQQKLDAAAAAEAAGNQAEADRLRQTLNRSERDALRGLGLESVDREVGRSAELAGSNAGFDRFFGAAERSAASRQRAQQAKIEAAIKVQQQLTVQVEIDTDSQTAEIARRVTEQVKIFDEKQRSEIVAEVQRQLMANDRNYQNRRRELQAAGG